MNPEIVNPSAIVSVVNQHEPQPVIEYRDFDIHEDADHPPKGIRFLAYTKHTAVDATTTRKVPTVKRLTVPRKPGDSLSGVPMTTMSVRDRMAAGAQNNVANKKEANMTFITPVMQVEYSNLGGIGVEIPTKTGGKAPPVKTVTLTTKPKIYNTEYAEMIKSLGDVGKDYTMMQRNLNDFLLQTAKFVTEDNSVMTTEKAEAASTVATQFKGMEPTDEQYEAAILQTLAMKITTPFPRTIGDFNIKFSTSSFFEVGDGKNAIVSPEILAMKTNPKYMHNEEYMKIIATIESVSKPRPNPAADNPKPINAKSFNIVSYALTEHVPQEIKDLAKDNPFFDPAPPGSLVSVNFAYMYTFYQDKFFLKLCPNNINVYYYNIDNRFKGSYEQRPQIGFKPMQQTIQQQVDCSHCPEEDDLPPAPTKSRRTDGAADVHATVNPVMVEVTPANLLTGAVTVFRTNGTNNNNNNNNAQQTDDAFDGFSDDVLNKLV